MNQARVGQFAGRHDGATVTIVGKGPTLFDYAELRLADGPVIFLNDAVQFERHVPDGVASYFFCHHQHQAAHLTADLRSTAVLPASGATGSTGKPLLSAADGFAEAAPRVALYEWDQAWRTDPGRVSQLTRHELAETNNLFIGPGVILPAIHFAWLCGASRIRFIGCDGFVPPQPEGGAYDSRIDTTASGSTPGRAFGRIRDWQDWLCERLGLATDYHRAARLQPLIPRRAWFVWLGPDPLPDGAKRNIDRFRQLHPCWDVHLVTDLPSNTPPQLRLAIDGCDQWCQVSDLVSYWLLFRYGGVYLDTDVTPLRSIEPLTHFRAWAGRQLNQRGESWNLNCAAMGSMKHGEAMGRVLKCAEHRHAQLGRPKRRAGYGPDLLTELFDAPSVRPWGTGNGLSVLPAHWWSPFACPPRDQPGEADGFDALDSDQQQARLDQVRHRFTDPTEPYGVHLYAGSHAKRAEQETAA
jgi:hypothetical protein